MPKLGKRTNLNVIFLVMRFIWQLHYIFALGPSPFLNFGMANIGGQQRDGDLEDFFAHENQQYPPSLSEYGNLHFTTKSDLLKCITRGVTQMPNPTEYDAKVLDGAAIVHSLPVSGASTFEEYAVICFLPHVTHTLVNCSRVDIVWDVYRTKSLKEATREKREKGVRRKVAGNVKMPRN
jgi:hypothetical protein